VTVDAKSNILYDTNSGELFEDIALQPKQMYDSPISAYDTPAYTLTETGEPAETVPTIRLLYADEPNDALITQLQTADYQSMLTWQDIVRVSGDFTYSHCPSQLAEQLAGAILMEEQVTDSVYHTAKLLVWEKLSKFVQTIPELYELSKLELNYLWEINKDAMFFFTLGEVLNSNLSSLQDQLESVKLFKLSEFDESGSFALAPSVTVNLLGRIFNILFPDYRRYEVEENLKLIPCFPNDRVISCFLLIMIFISLNKPDENSDKEILFLRLQTIQYKMEMSLKNYLENRFGSFNQISGQFGSYKELFDQCKQKIEIAKRIAEL